MRCFFAAMLFIPAFALCAKDILRGEIVEELEPVWAVHLGIKSPAAYEDAVLWAMEDAAAAFSAMIYGWSFEYQPEDAARGIKESLKLTPLGEIQSGDKNIVITDAQKHEDALIVWADYLLSEEQKYRAEAWKSNTFISVNAAAYSPLEGPPGITKRQEIKENALEEALKKALKTAGKLSNRNKVRLLKGLAALEKFPLYKINGGSRMAVGHFRIKITESIPFSAY